MPARCSSASIYARRSTASAATSRAPPSSWAWSARPCTASSRRWESDKPGDKLGGLPLPCKGEGWGEGQALSRTAYVNGRYVPRRAATVHVEDRGYQFADGVYEVCEVRGGKLVDERRHMDRLERSLSELRIDMPIPRNA